MNGSSQRDLVQQSHHCLLEQVELHNNKLYDICKKRIGLTRPVFDKIVSSGDLKDWTVGSCLSAAQKHDTKIIAEADAPDDEETQCLSTSHIGPIDSSHLPTDSPKFCAPQYDFDDDKEEKKAHEEDELDADTQNKLDQSVLLEPNEGNEND